MGERLAWVVVLVVLGSWVVTTVILPAALHGYTPPPEINTAMGSVAGGAAAFLFAQRSARKRKNDDGNAK